MTENCVYERNLLFVLESVIITVVRIQGFTTHHTVHTQNFLLVLVRQDLDRKMCVTMVDIFFGEKMLHLSARLQMWLFDNT